MNKNDIFKFVNKEKMATGVLSDVSKKIGLKPMYLRAGLIALTVPNPFIGVAVYGAGFAYKKFKK